jgi:TPR repeat protein
MNLSRRPLYIIAVAAITSFTGCTGLGGGNTTDNTSKAAKLNTMRVSTTRDIAFEKGSNAYAAKDYRTAHEVWLPLAECGISSAQTAIAYLYAMGQGVPQSDSEALTWFAKAAQQGDADAQNNLGYMYSQGRGIKASREQAIKWYLEAAQRGHRTAQQNLFALTNDGLQRKSVAPPTAEIVRIKAHEGEALYQFLYGMSYLVGNGSQESDESAAVNWVKKAADKGFAAAEHQLGLFYLNGRGLTQDQDRAYYWIARAADKKYFTAISWMKTLPPQQNLWVDSGSGSAPSA